MYEMEGPRRVPPRTTDPVARARALRRDICPVDLASRLPGHRLRRDRRLATLASRLPGRLVRRGSRLATFTSRLPDCLVRRGVRFAALAADRSTAVCYVAQLSSEPQRVRSTPVS
jgi:hypothetical protein